MKLKNVEGSDLRMLGEHLVYQICLRAINFLTSIKIFWFLISNPSFLVVQPVISNHSKDDNGVLKDDNEGWQVKERKRNVNGE